MPRIKRKAVVPLSEDRLARVKTDEFSQATVFTFASAVPESKATNDPDYPFHMVIVLTAVALAADETGFVPGNRIPSFIKKYRKVIEEHAVTAVLRGLELLLKDTAASAKELQIIPQIAKVLGMIISRHPEFQEAGARVLSLTPVGAA